MVYGFELNNASLSSAIDDNSVVPYVIAEGSVSSAAAIFSSIINIPAEYRQYAPMVLMRPKQYEQYVGACVLGYGFYDATAGAGVGGQAGGWDWKVVCAGGAPIVDSTAWGAEFYAPDGRMIYSSRRKHIRLKQVIQIPPSALANGQVTVGISGFTQTPWVAVNGLILTGDGVGPESEWLPALCFSVSAGNTSVTIRWCDAADNFNSLYSKIGSEWTAYTVIFWAGTYTLSLYSMEEV